MKNQGSTKYTGILKSRNHLMWKTTATHLTQHLGQSWLISNTKWYKIPYIPLTDPFSHHLLCLLHKNHVAVIHKKEDLLWFLTVNLVTADLSRFLSVLWSSLSQKAIQHPLILSSTKLSSILQRPLILKDVWHILKFPETKIYTPVSSSFKWECPTLSHSIKKWGRGCML